MTTYKAAKLETRTGGMLLVLAGVLFAGVGLFFSLTEGSQFTPMTAILLPLFLCVFIEAGYSFSKKGVFRSEKWKQSTSSDTVETVGRGLNIFFLIKALLKNIKGFIILLLFAGGAVYFFLNYETEINFNREFYIQIATYLIYLILLRRLLVPVMGRMKELGQKFMTTYTVDANGVTFTLPDKDLSHPDRKYTIRVDFHEIDELKLLSYQEARSYMKYEFSPDLKKLSSAPKNWYLFLKENIRPQVYTRIVSGGAAVLMRGKENFYLITVNNDDPKDLVEAYQKSKATI